MKKLLFVLLSTLYAFTAYCQETRYFYYKTEVNGKHGLLDENGKEIIEPKYDYPFYFENEIAKVYFNGKLGLINTKGEEIIPPIYDELGINNKDLLVKYRGKCGLFNIKGEEIISPKYASMGYFSEGLCAVKMDSLWGFIDINENLVIPYSFEFVFAFKDGFCIISKNNKKGVINNKGEIIIPTKYDKIYTRNTDSKDIFRMEINNNQGIVDTNGIERIKPIYNSIGWFVKGYANIGMDNLKEDCKLRHVYGLINTNFEVVAKPECMNYNFIGGMLLLRDHDKIYYLDKNLNRSSTYYDFISYHISPTCYGSFLVKKNEKYGLIDTNFREVLPAIYRGIICLDYGYISVMLDNYKTVLLDQNYKEIIPAKYDRIKCLSREYLSYELNKKLGILNINGKEITKTLYDSISTFKDGISMVKLNNKYGFVDTLGNEIIPLKYDYISNFYDGLAKVILNGKYGYIDKKGNIIISCKYKHADNFHEGFASVYKNSSWRIINKKGKKIKSGLNRNDTYSLNIKFYRGIAIVPKKDQLVGIIDTLGNEILPFIYLRIDRFDNGIAIIYKDRKCGIINTKGEFIQELKYDYISIDYEDISKDYEDF